MTASLFFVAVALALVGTAALLLLTVVVRRGRGARNLMLAIFLIALAIGVWMTAIRAPLGGL